MKTGLFKLPEDFAEIVNRHQIPIIDGVDILGITPAGLCIAEGDAFDAGHQFYNVEFMPTPLGPRLFAAKPSEPPQAEPPCDKFRPFVNHLRLISGGVAAHGRTFKEIHVMLSAQGKAGTAEPSAIETPARAPAASINAGSSVQIEPEKKKLSDGEFRRILTTSTDPDEIAAAIGEARPRSRA